MSFQPVKFYQTGTFTVGNRLLEPDQRSVQANMERTNSLNSGHRACQGCGEALGARYAIDAAMHATNNQLIAANATGCLEVFSTPYPETSWQIPWIHSLFGNAAAVATVMIPGMVRAGYPAAFSASVIAAAGSTAILIPPSIAFILYSVLVPEASVPALFAAGMLPGVLAGIALMVPVVWLSIKHGFGEERTGDRDSKTSFWQAFKEAIWGLMAPVLILGGMRSGAFTPTEAAVVAVFYGLFVGLVIYRTLDWQAIVDVLAETKTRLVIADATETT